MIVIKYKLPVNLNFQYFNFEGRLFADVDDLETITTEWDNQTYEIQHIYSEVWRMECNVKETEFLALQKLKYAFDIYIDTTGAGTWIECDIVSFEFDEIFGEYKKCKLKFKKKSDKTVSNIIYHRETFGQIQFQTAAILLYKNFTMYLPALKVAEYERNIVDEFDIQIEDFTKLRTSYDCRLFFDETNYFRFLGNLQYFKSGDKFRLSSNSLLFYYFKILQNEKIGDDLYLIDIRLIYTTDIQTVY